MDVHHAQDWYKEGFRIMQARDIFPGDDYLMSYVEQAVMLTCQYRNDLGNGFVDVDGTYWQAEHPMWIRKHNT